MAEEHSSELGALVKDLKEDQEELPDPQDKLKLKKVAEAVEDSAKQLSEKYHLTANSVKDARKDYGDKYHMRDVPHSTGEPIRHEDPAHQVAYMCKYYNAHIQMTFLTLLGVIENDRNLTKLLPVLKENILRVCCLGGGPMPELVALCLFIDQELSEIPRPQTEIERQTSQHLPSTEESPGQIATLGQSLFPLLSARCLDLHSRDWKQYFDKVAESIYDKGQAYIPVMNVQPVDCDLTDQEQVEQKIELIKKSKIIFASKVFSDIYCRCPRQVEENATKIFDSIQDGSILVYIDNKNGASVTWLTTKYQWREKGFERLFSFKGCYTPQYVMPSVDIGGQLIHPGKQEKRVIIKVYYKNSKFINKKNRVRQPMLKHDAQGLGYYDYAEKEEENYHMKESMKKPWRE
jgi:hypothetical protein